MPPKVNWKSEGHIAVISVAITIGLLGRPELNAQVGGSIAPEFDAASVKLNTTPSGGRDSMPGGYLQFLPGRVVGRKVSVWRMVLEAYHISPYQLSAGPKWIQSDWYQFEAKAGGPATEEQLRLMLQTLLKQRCGLVMHHETKEMPVYALTLGKDGPKVLQLKEGDTAPSTVKELRSRGVVLPRLDRVAGVMNESGTMQHFVHLLNGTQKIDRPVINRTKLQGNYLFVFQWDSEENFMAEIQEQSGLKFVAQRTPMDIFSIDHIDKPAAN